MAANSFILKGWSVTLISALAVLAQKDTNSNFWAIALLPALTFWGLDGFYLRQERLFRELYNAVRVKPADEIDFSLNTQPVQSMVGSWLRNVFSKTLAPFYITILLSVLLIALFVGRSSKSNLSPKPVQAGPAPIAPPVRPKHPAITSSNK